MVRLPKTAYQPQGPEPKPRTGAEDRLGWNGENRRSPNDIPEIHGRSDVETWGSVETCGRLKLPSWPSCQFFPYRFHNKPRWLMRTRSDADG